MIEDRANPTEERPGKRARVYLCVDRPERRITLAALLASNPELQVIGRADASIDGVRGVVAAHPDVVVIEPDGPPIERSRLVARTREASPRCTVVAISAPDARPRTLAARGLVADRYLHPDDALERISEVVSEVARARHSALGRQSA
jgi:NarL family two-component system response regulator LiaR